MVRVYLNATDTTFTLSNTATVYGAAGVQKLIVNEGVTGVVADQLVERVDLPGSFADFTYKQAGNGLQVYDGKTLIATIPLQADGTQIVTSSGSVAALLNIEGVMTLGSTLVSDVAPGAVVPLPAAVDTTMTTGSTFVPVPTFTIKGPTDAVLEGTSAVYTVNLSSAQTTTTTVKVALGGTATLSTATVAGDVGTAASNMTATGATLAADGTLTFAPGLTSAQITVPVNFDTTVESGETLIATLLNPSTGVVLGAGANSATTLLKDAEQPTFTLTSSAAASTATQEGNVITFTVTPTGVVVNPTTMTLNLTAPKTPITGVRSADAPDFTPSATEVKFAPGDTAPKTVNVTVATDTTTEGLEAYDANLLATGTSGVLATVSTVNGLINDPVPALTLAQDKAAVDEGGSVVYTVTSTLDAPVGGITVPYTLTGTATAGTDYSGTATGNIVIAAGSKTGSVTVNTIADNVDDGTDTLIINLGTPSNGTITTGTVTTTINDTSKALGAAEIALTGAATVDEGGDLVYTVTRGSAVATGSTLTIPYTLTGEATNGTDYTGSAATGNLVMAAGASSASLTLKVTADSLTEATAENIIMTLGTLPAGTTVAAGRPSTITTAVNDTSKTVLGETGTLTTLATDSVLNKTIVNGVLDAGTTNRTWHVSDSISGTAAASDALNAIVLGNSTATTTDTYAGLATSLIENFNFRYIDGGDGVAGAIIDASGLTGAAKLAVKGSTINGTASDTFTINGAVATAALEVADNSSLLNVKFDNAGTATSADSVKVVTSGGSTGTVTLDDLVNNGFVTVNVTTETAASTLKGLDAGSTFTTLNVSGNQGLTITDALPTTVTTINAGANSGAVKLTTNSSTLTAAGGTGTTDVLTLNTIPTTGAISGFETVVAGAAASALNLATVTGATKLGVATGLGSAAFTNAAATTNTIHLSGSYQPNGAALTTDKSLTTGTVAYTPVSLATAAGDTLTIAVDNGGTANTTTYTAGTIAANQIENLTLTTADWTNVTTGNITQTVATTAAATFTASGAANLDLGTIVDIAGGLSDATGVDTYNFSGVTGTLKATMGGTGNLSVTGAAGADTLTTSAIADTTATVFTQTFNLGNGDDSITFAADVATDEGAGKDKLILNGEAGNDKFTYATAGTAVDDLITIAGGVGNDTLFVTGNAANGPTATVSGVEGITFNNGTAAAAKTTLAWTGGATDIVTITELNANKEILTITTVAGSGVLNTSNWVWQGWAPTDELSLTGDTGNDVLTGTIGLDTLSGGTGADTLNLGAGAGVADLVMFSSATAAEMAIEAGSTVGTATVAGGDTINQFETASDVIRFNPALFNNGPGAISNTLKEIAKGGIIDNADAFIQVWDTAVADAVDTVAGAVKVLNGLDTATVAIGERVLVAMDNDTDTFLWLVDQKSAANTIAAQDLTYVGKIAGVLDIANGDLTMVSASLPDTTPPTLTSNVPVDNATAIVVGSNLVLTFNENVTAVTGKNLVIYKTSDNSVVATIAADDPQIAIAGGVVTVNPSADLDASTEYYVLIDSGAFKDAANNVYTGISSTTALSFTTAAADTTAPTLTSSTPVDNATAVVVGSDIVLTFNENVTAVTGKNLVIYKTSDNSVVATIAADDPQIAIAGGVVTVNPSADLDASTEYYVLIDSG
ncbi:hypothetical protein CKO12_04770, partial [Chromatium okenii]|uniref:beta strand repeat-containing protein n=1 Tax=Chromatium okenii TaxID=61644 RepID=UPI001903CAD3